MAAEAGGSHQEHLLDCLAVAVAVVGEMLHAACPTERRRSNARVLDGKRI